MKGKHITFSAYDTLHFDFEEESYKLLCTGYSVFLRLRGSTQASLHMILRTSIMKQKHINFSPYDTLHFDDKGEAYKLLCIGYSGFL
jgi:hypothetical protein